MKVLLTGKGRSEGSGNGDPRSMRSASPVSSSPAGPVLRYVAARIGQGVVVVFGAVTISFVLTNLIGNPADALGGLFLTGEQRVELNALLGYDKPLIPRYIDYLLSVLEADFGTSFRTGGSALSQVLSALPDTLILVLASLVLAVLVSLPLAIFSVSHREGNLDRSIRRSIGALQGMPNFWIGLMLILVFSVRLNVFPAFGFRGPSSLILPAVSLALPITPTFFRIFRGELLDVMAMDFVEAMRARGLSERAIIYRHGIRNMVGPAITFTALQLGYLIGGSIVVETVFSWPGIGSLAISSIQARDFVVVQAIIVIVAASYVLLNLIADLVVLLNDPRVRAGTA